MTQRKILKKELSKLKYMKNSLPRLIDCSEAYGDDYYNDDMMKNLDKEISEIEAAIKGIDVFHLKKEV